MTAFKGRGSLSNPDGRFERQRRGALDVDALGDWADWGAEEDAPDWGAADDLVVGAEPKGAPVPRDPGRARRPRTTVSEERCRSIVSENDSPDIPFARSVNPYRGCEHGCVYCFARPSHGYLGLSSGLDFETRLWSKPDAAELLRAELSRPSYRCEALALGANTDPYQPIERELGITRSILEVLLEARHPVGIVTKSHGILRDLDLLERLASERLVHVYLSVTTLDPELARRLEPRASSPHRRLAAIARLAEAKVPVGVLVSPIIPGLNDHEIERVLEAARRAGATRSGSLLVRLPHEVDDLFVEWLEHHYPERKERVLARIRECVNGDPEPRGRLYDPTFGVRMRGRGAFAELLRQRYELAARKLGFERAPYPFESGKFQRPLGRNPRQLPLFPR